MHLIDLAAQQKLIRSKIEVRIEEVLNHGKYIMGPEVTELESQLSNFSGAKHAVTCSNGTDALLLPLMAKNIGPGDAIFIPSFTYVATAEVVSILGATPIFVDVQESSFNMDTKSLEKAIDYSKSLNLSPKAVIPVDLFGQPADYDSIKEVATKYNLWILADSAQGFGSTYKGKKSGNLGLFTATSFFPAKPLGCYGDGGAIFTENDELANTLCSLRVHGKGKDKYDNVRIGLNARLDTIQAAILIEKLSIFKDEIEARNNIAIKYSQELSNFFEVPKIENFATSVWAQYTLKAKPERRDEIITTLKKHGIPSVVYYPTPLHLQTAYKKYELMPEGLPVSEKISKQVFSIPMHPYLTESDQDFIISTLINKCH
jgi:dTDP-4-amino-4,6-dideoxygalactose transaminase